MSNPWHDKYGYYARELSPTDHDARDHSGVPGITGLTAIRGRVNANGSEAADTGGFTSVKNSAGDYTVTYAVPFEATPLVIVQAQNTSGTTRLGFLIASSASSFNVATTTFAGSNSDAIFSFIAVGY